MKPLDIELLVRTLERGTYVVHDPPVRKAAKQASIDCKQAMRSISKLGWEAGESWARAGSIR
jgi:hypothetical protein